uniref:Uncharacterized protein n=1 Tax=Sipha flava TaxID=143950 RepID=A0A2S2R0V8_9HEMI
MIIIIIIIVFMRFGRRPVALPDRSRSVFATTTTTTREDDDDDDVDYDNGLAHEQRLRRTEMENRIRHKLKKTNISSIYNNTTLYHLTVNVFLFFKIYDVDDLRI